MLMLNCPCCGVDADESELAPGGQAHIKRFGVDASDEGRVQFKGRKRQRDIPGGGRSASRPEHPARGAGAESKSRGPRNRGLKVGIPQPEGSGNCPLA